ncbi:Rieske (2Fe-2S) protein [Azospirillum doebereinerae]|uniref:Rieske (2Fe-2S) protein n=1 Tax=Azospirillum doebereinerae TaxID=92933 RepID=A0A3S0XMJ4_9PROT|nr:Rieske (2Fe-2S) protein [Azospirillum doebereinerae]
MRKDPLPADDESWRQDPQAPAPGTALGPLDALPDGEAKEFRFGEGRRVFSMLTIRQGDAVRAYVNACPHVWLPLTYRHGRVLSEDGRRLICSSHFAEFSVEDGRPLSGPVTPGCRLAAVPVLVDPDGLVRIAS